MFACCGPRGIDADDNSDSGDDSSESSGDDGGDAYCDKNHEHSH